MTHREQNANPRGTPWGIIGDRNPIEHWGGIIYRKPGNQYSMVYFQSYDDSDDDGMVSVFEFDIEDDVVEDLNWVKWDAVANYIGMPVDELKEHARSSNVHARASVYESVAGYYGFGNLDHDQQEMTLKEAERKFGRTVDAALRAENARRSKNPETLPSNKLKSKLLR